MLFDVVKAVLLLLIPSEFSLFHALGEGCHNSAEIPDETSVE